VTHRQYGIESAFYFWDARNLNTIADSDDVEKVTTKVNGGLNGLPDRKARLQRVKQALGI
jgi:predicted chitinase